MKERKPFLCPFIVFLSLAVAFCTCCRQTVPSRPSAEKEIIATSNKYEGLVQLFDEWREFLKPRMKDAVPDYSQAGMKEQYNGLKKMQQRLAAFDTTSWPTSQRVDYLVVKAEMNGLEFEHRVLRPWARDPGYYAVFSRFSPARYGTISVPRFPIPPNEIAEFRARLQAIPEVLKKAESNLTEPAADLNLLGVDFKNSAVDGKYRESERLTKLAEDLANYHPELVPEVVKAREAVDAYKNWIKKNKDGWAKYAGVGIDNYNWYLKNVWLLPYTWEELVALAERELERATAAIAMERHHNRKLPPLQRFSNESDYVNFYNTSQSTLLEFLNNEDILTIPDYMKLTPLQGHRFDQPPQYFANVQERDPLPLMAHDFVGHGPDMIRNRMDKRPIRGIGRLYHMEGSRSEGYAAGMEENLMHLGLFDERPRARELTYHLLAYRAARALADLKMHSNELTFREAFQYVVDVVPDGWVPSDPTDNPLLWGELDLYLHQPGYGVSYLIGSIQLQQLIADRAMQLGNKFDIKAFLDEFITLGWIPFSLIRWEMTGFDDQVKKLW